MSIEESEFFKEATLRICGNLEIESALHSLLLYLKELMPVTRMYLSYYDETLKSTHIIAHANEKMSEKLDLVVPLPEDASKIAKNISSYGDVALVKNPEEFPLTRHTMKVLKVSASSIIGLMLQSDGKMIGSVGLHSDGEPKFDESHLELIKLLKGPMKIAMSNSLKHREVLKLKDVLADDNRYLHGELRRLSGDEIIGANFGLNDVMQKAGHVASLDSPVLLLGETGVGKDVIANAIHYSSNRKDGPFVSVNCGAIPETLIDSELFGHEKGAFTGALTQKRGRFERADKGTIFLDEIGELPLHAQVRLLRVLQDKEIERIGGDKTIQLDIRIIAATNRDLEKMVQSGDFREDLWFRLNVFPIMIPALREREQDIPALLQHFISLKVRELKLPHIPEPAAGSIEILMNYDWPGNVRELSNIVERAMILNPTGPLDFSSLIPGKEKESDVALVQSGLIDNLDQLISNHIKSVIERTNGKVHGPGGAAEILGVNPSSLRNKMKKYGIKHGRSFKR
ncbi:MAG: sigma 54-interacting transcriptional regulator [Desulfobacterales bacterium]